MLKINSGLAKDSVQMDKRNTADAYILDWWVPKTTIDNGIRQVFNEMKKNYELLISLKSETLSTNHIVILV